MSQNKIKLYQIDQSGAAPGQIIAFNSSNGAWEPYTLTLPSLTGYATEAFVTSSVNNLIDAAPQNLNTLNELASALNDDANFGSTVITALNKRLRVDINNQTLTEVEKENARTNLGLTPLAFSGSFADLTNKPTTVSGYGITDAATLSGGEVLSNKILSAPIVNDPTINRPKVKGEQAAAIELGTLLTGECNINLSSAQIFSATVSLSATVTFTFSNPPVTGHSQMVMLQLLNGGGGTILWPTGTKFSSGVPPVLTSNGVDLLGIFYNSFLNSYVIFLLGKDIK